MMGCCGTSEAQPAQDEPLVASKGSTEPIDPPTNCNIFVVLQFLVSFGVAAALPWIVAYTDLPCWTLKSWWASAMLCGFLWEMWITMGLAGGLPLSIRVPGGAKDWVNWFLMSAGDSFIILHLIMMGSALLLVPAPDGFPRWSIFTYWDARVLAVMWVTGYLQNPIVTIMLERRSGASNDSKMIGTRLSWYPIAPTLPTSWDARFYPWNPLARINQGWAIMPPLWYAFLIHGVSATPLPCPIVTLGALVVGLCTYAMYFADVWPSKANLGGTTPWEPPVPEGGTQPQCANIPTSEYWDRWEVNSWFPKPGARRSVAFAIAVPFASAAAIQAVSVLVLHLVASPETWDRAFSDCSLRCVGWPQCA